MKPDYGLVLLRTGLGSARQFFYGVPVTHLSASAPRLFTFVADRIHGSVEYAVSFDFDSIRVTELLRQAERCGDDLIGAINRVPLGQTVEFEIPIVVDIEAELGTIQRTAREEFVPFVVSRVAGT
jgi:hypothetical protein